MNTSDTFLSMQKHYTDTTAVNWQEVYALLKPIAKSMVYTYHVPAWRGQENDIAEDIVQEVARRLLEYKQKLAQREATPIQSLKPMLKVIAYNYGKDMRRRDLRMTRIEVQEDDDVEQQGILNGEIDAEECATENVYYEMLFTDIAREIATFPYKQRRALLVDLATRMSFEQQPTPLQKAFLKVGIHLEEYQNLQPSPTEERNRYTSLLAHAYRRISALACIQEDVLY